MDHIFCRNVERAYERSVFLDLLLRQQVKRLFNHLHTFTKMNHTSKSVKHIKEEDTRFVWRTVREIRALSHRYHVGDDSQRSSATMLRVCLFRYQAIRSPPVSVFTTLVPQSCWGDQHTCCSHCVSRVACRLRARVVVVEPPTAS